MNQSVASDEMTPVIREMSRRMNPQKSTVVLRADFAELEESGKVEEALAALVN